MNPQPEPGRPRLPALMPRKRDEVLVADFDTELVVLEPDDRQAHHLDEGLSLVLTSCDGRTPSAEVVAEVMTATGDDRVSVEAWLVSCLDRLDELKMFAPAAED